MENKRVLGGVKEEAAAQILRNHGYEILEKNYRCRMGEIDLIAKDRGYLVFVEVKYRRTKGSGYAAEAVTLRKQRTICKVAAIYIKTHFQKIPPCRFDVVGIDGHEVTIYQNAFTYRR